MSYELLHVEIQGVVPTIMHNGQLADPMNKWSLAIKEITSKRKKTEADIVKMHELEWFGGLYVNEEGVPCWPGENVEAMIRSAARRSREGKEVEKGLLSNGNWPVIFKGSNQPEKLWADERFRIVRAAVVNKSRVMRCRPIFHDWKLKFELEWDPDYLNEANVRDWVSIAGREIGLSDWRPKFGRFEVLSIQAA